MRLTKSSLRLCGGNFGAKLDQILDLEVVLQLLVVQEEALAFQGVAKLLFHARFQLLQQISMNS